MIDHDQPTGGVTFPAPPRGSAICEDGSTCHQDRAAPSSGEAEGQATPEMGLCGEDATGLLEGVVVRPRMKTQSAPQRNTKTKRRRTTSPTISIARVNGVAAGRAMLRGCHSGVVAKYATVSRKRTARVVRFGQRLYVPFKGVEKGLHAGVCFVAFTDVETLGGSSAKQPPRN